MHPTVRKLIPAPDVTGRGDGPLRGRGCGLIRRRQPLQEGETPGPLAALPTHSQERPREDTASQEESPHQKPGHRHLDVGRAACGSVRAACLAFSARLWDSIRGQSEDSGGPDGEGVGPSCAGTQTPQRSSPLSDHVLPLSGSCRRLQP